MLSKYAGEPILTAVNQKSNQLHSNKCFFPIPFNVPYYSLLTQFDLILIVDPRTEAGRFGRPSPFQLRFSSI